MRPFRWSRQFGAIASAVASSSRWPATCASSPRDRRKFGEVVDRPGRNARLHEGARPFQAAPRHELLLDAGAQGVPVLHASGVVPEFGRVGQVVEPKHSAEPRPHVGRRRGEVERPVGGPEQGVGADDRVVVADRRRRLAKAELALALNAEKRHQRAKQRGLDDLPLAVRRCWVSAASVPIAAHMPAVRSPIGTPKRNGPVSDVPVRLMRPDMPCAIWSKPGQSP